MSKLASALVMHVSAYPYQQKIWQLYIEFYGLVRFYPKQMYWRGQKKLVTFHPRQDFFPMFVFLYGLTIKQMKQNSL